MKNFIFKCWKVFFPILFVVFFLFSDAFAAKKKKDFTLAWSIYVGWMPWHYINESGIMKKWAKKYGINVKIVQINDYIESINQYTAGKFDAVVGTNMDLLAIPCVSGVDTTALITSASYGNDMFLKKGRGSIKSLKGKKIHLVELSVSHYLLVKALSSVGMKESDVKIVNTSDADILSVYKSKGALAAVTWNPMALEMSKMKNTYKLYDSKKIPGEIMDMIGVNTEVLKANPNFAKAILGAWFEALDMVTKKNSKGKMLRKKLGELSGGDLKNYEEQLKTTKFYSAKEASKFYSQKKIQKIMKEVAQFSFDKGLYGNGAKNWEFIGIEFPKNKVVGNKKNVKMRFDSKYFKMAAK